MRNKFYNTSANFFGDLMRKIALGALLLGALLGCGKAGKFSGGERNFGAVVEFARWPAIPKGVAGYNLYMAQSSDGKFDKVNDSPITGGDIIVPDLVQGQNYFFKMTAVSSSGLEGKPGGVFTRKAGSLNQGQTRPAD
jgi:hypothetical protein